MNKSSFNKEEYQIVYKELKKRGVKYKFDKNELSNKLYKQGVPLDSGESNILIELINNHKKIEFYNSILSELDLSIDDVSEIPTKHTLFKNHRIINSDFKKTIDKNIRILSVTNIDKDKREIMIEINETMIQLIPILLLIKKLRENIILPNYNLDKIVRSRNLLSNNTIEITKINWETKILHFIKNSEGLFVDENTNYNLLKHTKKISGISINNNVSGFIDLGTVEEINGDVLINSTFFYSLKNLKYVKGRFSLKNCKIKTISNIVFDGKLDLINCETLHLKDLRLNGGMSLNKNLKDKYIFENCVINGSVNYFTPLKLKKSTLTLKDIPQIYTPDFNFNFLRNRHKIKFNLFDVENQFYLKIKKEILNGKFDIQEFGIDSHLYSLLRNLKFNLIYDYNNDKISKKDLIKNLKICFFLIDGVSNDFFDKKIINYFRQRRDYDLIYEMFSWEKFSVKFYLINVIELETKRKLLNGNLLLTCLGLKSQLNKFTTDNSNYFIEYIDNVLNGLYGENYSFFESLLGFKQTNKEHLKEFDGLYTEPKGEIKKSNSYFYKNRNLEPFKKYIDLRKNFDENCKTLYGGNKYGKLKLVDDKRELPYVWFIENLFVEIFSSIILSSENKFRNSRGVPNIGEGWVSETNLYYELKEYFHQEEVIHHGKPSWLGRQHIDIWFPEYKIGVEYQGLQHDEPVDFFGGEEIFKKNLERDERKKRLFKENDSILIEVRPNYKLDDVVNEIKKLIH